MKLLFLLPLFVWCVIQWVKVLIDYTVEKKIYRSSLWSSGWFPSVHAGIASSICTVVLIYAGLDSMEFAIAFTFSFLFWYDAANLRYQAWQHATSLNQIQKELKELIETQSPKAIEVLKERLWHTIWEVIWGILAWILITLLILTILW